LAGYIFFLWGSGFWPIADVWFFFKPLLALLLVEMPHAYSYTMIFEGCLYMFSSFLLFRHQFFNRRLKQHVIEKLRLFSAFLIVRR
jgi:hypothetical protein